MGSTNDFRTIVEAGLIRADNHEMVPSRWSPMTLDQGTKRPEVFALQHALTMVIDSKVAIDGNYGPITAATIASFQQRRNLADDGIVGAKTWKAIFKQLESNGFGRFNILWPYNVMSVIAYFETNKKDAFGAVSDVGDGAGVNYGIWQVNSLGSLNRLLLDGNRNADIKHYHSHGKHVVDEGIKEWMGTASGIRAQIRYMQDHIINNANDNMAAIGWTDGRDASHIFFADVIVNNGTIASPYRTIRSAEAYKNAWNEAIRALPDGYYRHLNWATLCDTMHAGGHRENNTILFHHVVMVTDPKSWVKSKQLSIRQRLVLIGALRGLLSRSKYRMRSVRRKVALAANGGKIRNGRESIDFCVNFGIKQ